MAIKGKFGIFESNLETWDTYLERFDVFCTVNDIADDKKAVNLLNYMGAKTYGLAKGLLHPTKAANATFKQISDKLKEHLNPAPLFLSERFAFYKRDQQLEETVAQFLAELRTLAVFCKFDDFLNQALRDRFICGLKSETLLQILLAEGDIDLSKAFTMAMSFEKAQEGVAAIQQKSPEFETHKLLPKAERCVRCGKTTHHQKDCWFKDKICNGCGKVGHIVRACRSKKPGRSEHYRARTLGAEAKLVHEVRESSVSNSCSDSDLEAREVSCLKIKAVQKSTELDTMWVRLTISGVSLKLELDTGSALTVINEKDYYRYFSQERLQKTNIALKTYTGQKLLYQLLRGLPPSFFKPRPVPFAIRPAVEAELDNLEQHGVLSRIDWSEWATPIVPGMKKALLDGPGLAQKVRICGDFKVTVNPVLKVVQYPLPKIDEIFASLAGGQHFSKIDLAQAYLQMEVEEDSRHYLTINTHKGLYRYNRLVFGVASAPAMWQRAMEQVLQGIPGTQCYLDDILITGRTVEEHLSNLERVLGRLKPCGLRANKAKCDFFKEQLAYCGHLIDRHGLHKSPDKIAAVVNAPAPVNVSQLRSFLGLINYYHKFLPNLSAILYPLNGLLKSGVKWNWSLECVKAFADSKALITSRKVLAHFDPAIPIKLACDASPYGIGAVLSHQFPGGHERPIAFASRSLSTAEKNYAQIDREALSLVWGVKKFNHYLYGQKFTLITDHQPLVSIFNPKKGVPLMTAQRLQRWALFLGAHRYDIQYRGTKLHGNADSLSRLPLPIVSDVPMTDVAELFHMSICEVLPVDNKRIERETRNDRTLSGVYDVTVRGWPAEGDSRFPQYSARREQLSTCRGTVMCGSRVVIPQKLQKQILEELHVGHLGCTKMKSLARAYVWWPGIDGQIEELAKNCSGCRLEQKTPPLAPIHPWEWPSGPWKRVHIDYAGPFQESMFLVVVDAHSKWPEVIKMSSTTSQKTIVTLRTIFARYGLPEQICSDNGPQFVSEDFKKFLKTNGIKHYTSAPYHPATNGLAERFVQTFKKALKAMKHEDLPMQHKLDNFLFNYRNAVHAVTGQSPAMVFFNRQLGSKLDLVRPDLRRQVEQKVFHCAPQRLTRSFQVGEAVLARDYRNQKWQPGVVAEVQGPLMYAVNMADGQIRRHVDQIVQSTIAPHLEPRLSASDQPVSMGGQWSNKELEPMVPMSCYPVLAAKEAPMPSLDISPAKVAVQVPDQVVAIPKQVFPSSEVRCSPVESGLRRSTRISRPPQRLIDEL
ncbi:uncharacterized protein K02A2.6-like [Amblyraja radiata]|uniref:uncharacterized protein K02A2.6-like n=1 Tax=Amblyraja radiata TaxID=386614 RepID=UPI001402EE3B|nr:uncharacterized protein K02A2.6-like [Amblyraja radiata]